MQSDRVVLAHSEKRQRRCQVLRVLQLGDFAARVSHRSARINQQMYLRVRVTLIFFDVKAVCAREQFPVEVPEVVARHVLAMLCEVCRKPEMRRAMKPADEAFDYGARNQFERAYARQHFRREESRCDLTAALHYLYPQRKSGL